MDGGDQQEFAANRRYAGQQSQLHQQNTFESHVELIETSLILISIGHDSTVAIHLVTPIRSLMPTHKQNKINPTKAWQTMLVAGQAGETSCYSRHNSHIAAAAAAATYVLGGQACLLQTCVLVIEDPTNHCAFMLISGRHHCLHEPSCCQWHLGGRHHTRGPNSCTKNNTRLMSLYLLAYLLAWFGTVFKHPNVKRLGASTARSQHGLWGSKQPKHKLISSDCAMDSNAAIVQVVADSAWPQNHSLQFTMAYTQCTGSVLSTRACFATTGTESSPP